MHQRVELNESEMYINSIVCIFLWLAVNISGLYADTCGIVLSDLYSCEISIDTFEGTILTSQTHLIGRTDTDVKYLKVHLNKTVSNGNYPVIFSQFDNVSWLNVLSGMEIINKNSFERCEMVKYLSLENNLITLLPNRVFEMCKTISTLILKRNRIEIIESDAFAGLSELIALDISYNLISVLDFNVGYILNLYNFYFSNNQVAAVKTNFLLGLKELNFLDGQMNLCVDAETYKGFSSFFDVCYAEYEVLTPLEKQVTVSCNYYQNKDYGYTCEISNVKSTIETKNFIINGKHLSGKTDESVKLFVVKSSNMTSIPNEIFTKFPALNYLSMSNVGITTLNEISFLNAENLKIIWMNNNNITKLPAFVFKATPKLEQLMLIHNQISEINVNAFKGASSLLRLDMSENKVQTIQSGLLESLTKLQILMLNKNEIIDIHDNALKGLTKLRYLNLNGSKIQDNVQQKWFESTTDLQELYLQNNKIKTFDYNAFKTLTKLRVLHFYSNNVTHIDSRLFSSLTMLKELRGDHNQIADFDVDTFKTLSLCEFISFAFNNLIKLKSNYFQNCLSLKSLHLNNNQIYDIEKNASSKMLQFNEIKLGGNNCIDRDFNSNSVIKSELSKYLKPCIDALPSCRYYMDLSNNYCCELTGAYVVNAFDGFNISGNHMSGKSDKDVLVLNIRGCSLKFFPNSVFETFINLETLDASTNKIENITSNSFANAYNVKKMVLSNNSIAKLPASVFINCAKLEELSLEQNIISDIDEDAFNGLLTLGRLNLINNQINAIAKNVFTKLPLLKTLELEMNICVSRNFQIINSVNIDVIPNISKCIINFNMNLNKRQCKYKVVNGGYTCIISDIIYLTLDDVFDIEGTHVSGKTDEDIVTIIVEKSKLFRVPDIFFSKFKNLSHLEVRDVGMKIIDGNTINSCEQLNIFNAQDNQITKVSVDAFAKCLKLKELYLDNNKVYAVEASSEFLEKQTELSSVSMLDNYCIDKQFNVTELIDMREMIPYLETCYKMYSMNLTDICSV